MNLGFPEISFIRVGFFLALIWEEFQRNRRTIDPAGIRDSLGGKKNMKCQFQSFGLLGI